MQGQAYRLLGDQPYEKAGDPFGFTTVARELKDLILRSRDATPFTIGIEASWGRGKSSLMAQLIRELESSASDTSAGEPEVEITKVSFNAWTAEGADVLEGLIKSVLEAMDRKALKRSLRNEHIMNIASQLAIAIGSFFGLARLADAVWERLSVDARRRNQINELVRHAMEEWRAGILKTSGSDSKNRLLVVSIDDLDRCSPENVLKVFEAVKVYLEAPGFVFIIGYDRDVISDAILEQKTYSNEITGIAYIEKIVQTVFRIPLPNDEQVSNLLDGFLVESGTTDIFDIADRELLIERNARNPRRIKRFINRFILDYRLDDTSEDFDPQLLIKLLLFETYFPNFARLFYDAGDKNPVAEFLDFAQARTQLQRGRDAGTDLAQTLEFYGLGDGGSPSEILQRLERAVPEAFNTLIGDRSFISLVSTFSSSEGQDELMQRVQRRRERSVESQGPATPGDGAPTVLDGMSHSALAQMSILWAHHNPERNLQVIRLLRANQVLVMEATSGLEALRAMGSAAPTLLISDVDRMDDPEGGFRDVKRIRSELHYEGPVIFFASRISTEGRAQANKLGASIVDTEQALLQRIVAYAVESSLSAQAAPESQSAPPSPSTSA